MATPHRILFLCTGNSARSIMAEAIANGLSGGRLQAYSAGSRPTGTVHPLALAVLAGAGLPTRALRSKSWNEFGGAQAPQMDFVFTLCDRAAGETCPVWPGHPINGHWGFEDPTLALGDEAHRRQAFERVFHEIATRIRLFLSLPIESLDRLSLQRRVSDLTTSNNEPGDWR